MIRRVVNKLIKVDAHLERFLLGVILGAIVGAIVGAILGTYFMIQWHS